MWWEQSSVWEKSRGSSAPYIYVWFFRTPQISSRLLTVLQLCWRLWGDLKAKPYSCFWSYTKVFLGQSNCNHKRHDGMFQITVLMCLGEALQGRNLAKMLLDSCARIGVKLSSGLILFREHICCLCGCIEHTAWCNTSLLRRWAVLFSSLQCTVVEVCDIWS